MIYVIRYVVEELNRIFQVFSELEAVGYKFYFNTVKFIHPCANDLMFFRRFREASLSNKNKIDVIFAVVEPVTYRLSTRGRPQLVHDGYVYNLTSRSVKMNSSHYRCAEQHRGCRGKCAVISERFMPTGVRDHNHPPGYQSEYDYRKKKGQDIESV